MTEPPDDLPTPDAPDPARRTLLKLAGAAAIAGALPACAVESRPPGTLGADAAGGTRPANFDRATLDAVAEVVLPGELGTDGRRRAVDDFVKWVEEYAPVAEEMHGYGYPDIRYLPPDPAPAWRAQLEGLDLRAARRAPGAGRTGPAGFAALPRAERERLVTEVLQAIPGDRLPAPLAAPHIALALLAHWAGSADAWDLALGARVGRGTCRALDDAIQRPRPLEPRRLG